MCLSKPGSGQRGTWWQREGVGMLLVFVIPWGGGKWYRNRFLTWNFQIQSRADGFICLALCFSRPWFCLSFPKDGVTDPGVTLTSCFGFEPLQKLRMQRCMGEAQDHLWYCVTGYFCSPSRKYQCLLRKKQHEQPSEASRARAGPLAAWWGRRAGTQLSGAVGFGCIPVKITCHWVHLLQDLWYIQGLSWSARWKAHFKLLVLIWFSLGSLF